MTIRIKPAIVPPARGYTLGESILAESGAYARLRMDLERYARDELPGASYLVSGHRGSGKTTAVHQAIANARGNFDNLKEPRRLLLVRLNGPDFLRDIREPPPAKPAVPDRAVPDAANPPASGAASDTPPTGPLIQVTNALYRALTDEVALGFWRIANEDGDPELAARMRIELDGGPTPDVIAEAWRRAGAIPTRGAFRELVRASLPAAGGQAAGRERNGVRRGVLFSTLTEGLPPDQAHRELVAVATAAQAYQRATGALETKVKRSSTRSHEQEIKAASPDTGGIDKVVQAMFGLAAGVGAGAAVATNNTAAAAAGLLTALVGAMGFRWASTRKVERSRTTSVDFVPDTAPETLTRVLPDLVRRLQDTGLYPVFVVDELDKVKCLGRGMELLVGRLKQFVTEQSFFCFLTDRDYFARLEAGSFVLAYPRSHTFFTNRVFVAYTTHELHGYLKRMFGVLGETALEDPEVAALRYVLLLRARSHAFDLRQEVERMREGDGDLEVPDEFLDRPRTHAELAMQLAVERRLRDPIMERFCSDPRNLQLAYDALYHPARMWRLGDATLDISLPAFTDAMNRRVAEPGDGAEPAATTTTTAPAAGTADVAPTEGDASPPPIPVAPGAAAGAAPPTPASGAPEAVRMPAVDQPPTPQALPNERRLEVLHEQLVEMITELCDIPGLARALLLDAERLGDDFVPEKVARVLAGSPLELLEPAGDGRYTWRCDDLGRQQAAPVDTEIGELIGALTRIGEMQEVVAGLVGSGLTMEGLNALPSMPPTPAWPETSQARERVRAHARLGDGEPLGDHPDTALRALIDYDEQDADLDQIRRYARFLEDNRVMLELYLGMFSIDGPEPGGDERAGADTP